MPVIENESLAQHTTFRLGGPARFFISCTSGADVAGAVAYAEDAARPLYVLGGGSNVLVKDEGVDAVVLHMALKGISFEAAGDEVLMHVGAGERWDDVVQQAVSKNLWGIENLVRIPGTMGGAVVQNIGAYGAELSTVFVSARVFNTETKKEEVIDAAHAAFGYRTSIFKQTHNYIVLEATLRLAKHGTPRYRYPDLASFGATHPQATPQEIAEKVAHIREAKFPHTLEEGTAGSFFKNPVVDARMAHRLGERFPELPQHPQQDGTTKLSLAWLLDKALGLCGYEKENVRLFERQPLVLVARAGATAANVDALANEITARVKNEINISIEREVETFGT